MTKPSIDKATPRPNSHGQVVPEQIWLQWYGDADPDLEVGEVSVEDVTWEREQIFKNDIPYVRQDIADERVKQARREVWDAAWLLLHDTKITTEATGRERNVISDDRRRLLAALEAARNAAEGEPCQPN